MRIRSRQRGVTLLEVLIAVLILSIGLLGMAALQAQTLKNAESSLQRTQASVLAYAALDAMRANRQAAMDGAYNSSGGKVICAVPAKGGTLASDDLNYWFTALKTTLGARDSTCGMIQCTTAGLCSVTVQWDEERALGGRANQSVVITGQI